MDWQPIDTAPKRRGESVLLHYSICDGQESCILIAVWGSTPEMDSDTWCDPTDWELCGDNPTHWMPLPKPPLSSRSSVGSEHRTSNSADTPGPWKANRVGSGEYDITAKDGDLAAVYISDGMDEPNLFPTDANAKLIAAAPELLDACKFAFAAMNSEEGRRRASDTLVAAIAKATV